MTLYRGDEKPTDRIVRLRERTRSAKRIVSLEQAHLITESYRVSQDTSKILQRANALTHVLQHISIVIDPDELIVGNRSASIRAGIVFPEAGVSWLNKELETLESRSQDQFSITSEDQAFFRNTVVPFWHGRTLEDHIDHALGAGIKQIGSVVKINQTDHAQGHICPNVGEWLRLGPQGIKARASASLEHIAYDDNTPQTTKDFLAAVVKTMDGAITFMQRHALASASNGNTSVAEICTRISEQPPRTFHEALQSVWFLFVILQLESNASSFSPGRMDQYLLPYFQQDVEQKNLTHSNALELLDALWIKFNQIVYMRNASSAQYFAGFPIGFNVTIGGIRENDAGEYEDGTNILSWMMLRSQEHIGLTQPNLTARLWKHTPADFIDACSRVIGSGGGMPQFANDESIISSLKSVGISDRDASNYALVGCVEISASGNSLGWSDAAMFNIVKVLELTLNNGVCMLSGRQLGPQTGYLPDFASFSELLDAYHAQIDFFVERMIPLCDAVDRLHAEHLPSPFLSGVVTDCIDSGKDVTAGGAHYNLSGIQAIQVANVADSLAALKYTVFSNETKGIKLDKESLLTILRSNYMGADDVRAYLTHAAPKYGNDVAWVDELGAEIVVYFAKTLKRYRNARGGPYHTGLYTVSAHVPMGKKVAATPDGRKAMEPLADGGVSAMYGRDRQGPTALMNSISRIPFDRVSNGSLLNMKFLPSMFHETQDRERFNGLVRSLIELGIHHAQFNVIDNLTLREAQDNPDSFRDLTIRVAGYTAYFIELAPDLQEEIIARTTHTN